ncbi:hypothetical protein BC829DRAFT_404647 [Chytridium lagenaria]|nr:hypothetical protein BC829DRAFT_404647 [Chytridium lagenaria]
MGYKRNVGLSTIILESDLTAIRMAIAGLHDMVFQSASSIPTLSSHNTVSDSNDSAVSHSNAVSVTSPTRLPISLSKDNLKLCRTIISGIAGRRLLNCTMPSRLIENHEDESWDDVPDVGERNSAKIVDSEALSICEDDEGSLETLIKHLRTKKSDFDPTLVTVRERRNSFYANLLTAVSDEVIALLPALRKGVVVVNGFEGDV